MQRVKGKVAIVTGGAFGIGRGEKIRTSGPCLPKTVLYQAELHPAHCIFDRLRDLTVRVIRHRNSRSAVVIRINDRPHLCCALYALYQSRASVSKLLSGRMRNFLVRRI